VKTQRDTTAVALVCSVLLFGAALAGRSQTVAGAESPATQGTFDVRNYGAVGDAKTLDTKAIQAAIDACHKSGGGKVYLGGGTFLSGTIFLKSNVTLYVESGAVLLGSPELKDYPDKRPEFRSRTEAYSIRSLIYAEKQENVAITGRGTIDGQGAKFLGQPKYRVKPFVCRFIQCKGVMTKNVTMRNSAMWMHLHLACDDVLVDGVTFDNWVNNCNNCLTMDGCHNVRVANCNFSSSDDCFELKSTSMRPCKNVTVTNCIFNSSCNGFKLGTESNGGFENIAISNCTIYDTRLAGIALELVDGGTFDRVSVSDIVMKNVGGAIFIRLGNRARKFKNDMEKPGMGTMKNISISNVQATGVGGWSSDCISGKVYCYTKPISPKTGLSITGLPGHPIENVSLTNIRLRFAGGGTLEDADREIPELPEKYPETDMFGVLPAYGFFVRHVKNVRLHNLDLGFEKEDLRPALALDDVEDVDIFALHADSAPGADGVIWLKQVRTASVYGCRVHMKTRTFVRLDGDQSGNVAVMNNDLSKVEQVLKLGSNVKKDAAHPSNNRVHQ